jgi:hypothetical protein
MSEKKTSLLGMNPSTASHRLVKDLLWSFVEASGCKCYRCGEPMSRDTFSIEHKDAWMSAPDPAAAFFDLKNVTFSHQGCNYKASRGFPSVDHPHGTRGRYVKGCRCPECREASASASRARYTPEKRKARYAKHGS